MTAATLSIAARDLASRLPPLLVAATHASPNAQQGVHGRRRAGMGETFWQFRRYAPGDPAQRIDWRQSARTDKYFVREKEYEAAQRVYLWADESGSMRYASAKELPTKAERAQLLTLALASLLQRGGEQVFWLQAHNILSIRGAQGLERVAAHFGLASTRTALPPLPTARQAHLILASDFLMEEADLRQLVADAAARNAAGAFLHIIDPLEDDFALDGRVELQGCEGEASLLLPNAASLRDTYRAKFAAHQALLKQLASGAGFAYVRHRTDENPASALLPLYEYLAGRSSR